MLKIDDLDPDGVKIIVNWDNMVIGASVFITCINTRKAVIQCTAIAARKKWTLKTSVIIQDGKLGVRIWRTL